MHRYKSTGEVLAEIWHAPAYAKAKVLQKGRYNVAPAPASPFAHAPAPSSAAGGSSKVVAMEGGIEPPSA